MKIRVPDDMNPGDWIARYTDARRRSKRGRIVIDDEGSRLRLGCDEDPNRVPEGVPLKILGISLPYIVCSVLCPGGAECGPEILDVRHSEFVRLNRAYVEAIADFSGSEASADGCALGGDDDADERTS